MKKHSILFVCHGNICRSPMAEFVMKKLVRDDGLEDSFLIDSGAVSYEEQGNDIYPPAKRTMHAHGIPFTSHYAHRISDSEASRYDLIIIMDGSNSRLISRILSHDNLSKVHLLMEYVGSSRDVSDPWYSGDFETTYDDILRGCRALLEKLKTE